MTTTSTNSANGANMTEPHIERFRPDVSIESLIDAMDRDGCAIVEDAISPELLASLNAEFDELLAASEPGTPNHIPMLIDFMGAKTHRIDGLPGKSTAFVDLLQYRTSARRGRPLPPAVVPPLPAQHGAADRDPARTRPSSTSTATTPPGSTRRSRPTVTRSRPWTCRSSR